MKIIKYDNSTSFLNDNEEFLTNKESFYNLILGLAQGIRNNTVNANSPLYYSISENNQIIGCAIRSNSERPLAISQMPEESIDKLILELLRTNEMLEGVVGEESTSTYFKDQWIKKFSLQSKVVLHSGVYECFQVVMPKNQNGELILMTDEHTSLARSYIENFMLECFPNQPLNQKEVEDVLGRQLKNKTLFLLKTKDNSIVSMAANMRSTTNGGTISLVYTPKELRGKGYASLVVALLSKKIMSEGKKFSNLYTDLMNPTSNSIYQKIGYIKIGQNIHFEFKPISH